MNIDFTNKTNIMEKYQLTGEQYDLLVKDLQKLTPAQLQILSDNFVLAWKTLTTEGEAFGGLARLTQPDHQALKKVFDWGAGGIPSPGATVMALITTFSADQRRQNKDQMIQESAAIVKTMLSQAKEIRQKAVTQIVMGVISGTVSIAQGAAALGMSAKAPSVPKGAVAGSAEMAKYTADLSKHTAKLQAVTGGLEGLGKGLGASGQAAGGFYDATVKEMDADIEKMRTAVENLRNFNQAFSEIIQKALSSHEAIQQSMNQARQKILG